jgi:acetyltransferase-like isoleucine patch superfamily enzyme
MWTSGGAINSPGVTIGADTLVGAGSVVTRDCDGIRSSRPVEALNGDR